MLHEFLAEIPEIEKLFGGQNEGPPKKQSPPTAEELAGLNITPPKQ